MTTRWCRVLLPAVLCACAAGGSGGDEAEKVALEPAGAAPPAAKFQVVYDQHGAVILVREGFSRDHGATWTPYPPALGLAASMRIVSDTELLVRMADGHHARWTLGDAAVRPIADQPADLQFTAFRREGPSLLGVGNEDRVYRWVNGTWTTTHLPLPPEAAQVGARVSDIVWAGSRGWVRSVWGIFSLEDGATEWKKANVRLDSPNSAPYFVGLADGRVMSYDRIATQIIGPDDSLENAPKMPQGERATVVCPDGALVNGRFVSRDGARTWTPVGAASFPLTEGLEVDDAFCGDDFALFRLEWLNSIGISVTSPSLDGPPMPTWDAVGQPGQEPLGGGEAFSPDGAILLSAGHPGGRLDVGTGTWTYVDLPARPFFLADGTAVALDGRRVSLSKDGGRTWTAKDAKAAGPFGELFTSKDGAWTGTSISSTQPDPNSGVVTTTSYVRRSSDEGATWTEVAKWELKTQIDLFGTQRTERIDGDSRDVLGETADGTLVAEHVHGDGTPNATVAVERSKDHGKTWEALPGATAWPQGARVLGMNPKGDLLVTEPVGATSTNVRVRAYANGGQDGGGKLWELMSGGQLLSNAALRRGFVKFDATGRLYLACNAIWCRSEKPVAP